MQNLCIGAEDNSMLSEWYPRVQDLNSSLLNPTCGSMGKWFVNTHSHQILLWCLQILS